MKTAIYPGSFDPVTLGHMDIILRASKIFDRLVVVVSRNSSKKTVFSAAERAELLAMATAGIPGVTVDISDGLLADYAKKLGDCVIIKGMRAVSDFELEFQMAMINKTLYQELDTLFLTTNQDYLYLSSSVVREVGLLGGDISGFVPKCVLPRISEKLRELRERMES